MPGWTALCALLAMAATSLDLTPPPPVHTSVRALLKYDALLLDQFGVIHDGKAAYPGAVAAVDYLLDQGVKVGVLSNSAQPKAPTVKRLLGMGFDTDRMAGICTSGMVTHEGLAGNAFPSVVAGGRSCVVLARGGDDAAFLELSQCTAAPVANADFILARGVFGIYDGDYDMGGDVFARFREVLAVGAVRGLPMLCCNPDLVRPDGSSTPMPGVFAAEYEALGGAVVYVGKPYAAVYAHLLETMGAQGLKVCGVGDSMLHDIKGAKAAGVDGCFMAGGIDAPELGLAESTASSDDSELAAIRARLPAEAEAVRARLPGFLSAFKGAPDMVLPRFVSDGGEMS